MLFQSTKKAAANTRERQPQPYYFKRPGDCDAEGSLEERRVRTVLRTAMLSTRADRYYGPPDGIQPEFDLLFAARLLSRSRRKLYRSIHPKAKVELRVCRRHC